MKVNYGIIEVRQYQIVREWVGDDDIGGGTEPYGTFYRLEQAERVAQRLSETEPGSGWYTVPKPE